MAKSYADQMGILYMERQCWCRFLLKILKNSCCEETSAKSGQNVNELFHELLDLLANENVWTGKSIV